MSYSSLKKKLQPAKKALKTLTKSLESKLHSFSFSESLNAIKTTSRRLLSHCSRRLHRRRRRRYNSHLYQSYYSSNRNNKNRCYKSLDFSPIHVDQFYSAPVARSPGTIPARSFHPRPVLSRRSDLSKRKIVTEKLATDIATENGGKGKEKILYSIEDAWREVVAKSPQLRPIDDRAEEFICNFRREMRLQKEKSIVDYQEMLSRGT